MPCPARCWPGRAARARGATTLPLDLPRPHPRGAAEAPPAFSHRPHSHKLHAFHTHSLPHHDTTSIMNQMHEKPDAPPAPERLVGQNCRVREARILHDDPEMRAARRPWCPPRALARDRRRIAVHEAGHYVIARHLGLGHVFAVIWQGEDAPHPARDVWRGMCRHIRVDRHARPIEDGMMLGCAGLVAELAWREMTKGGALRRVADYLREPDSMSRSDWSTCHAPPGDPAPALIRAAEHVAALLTPHGGPLWPELRGVARVLMRSGFIASSGLARMHHLCWQPPRVVFCHRDLEVLSDWSGRRVGSAAAPSLAEVSAAIDAMKAAESVR